MNPLLPKLRVGHQALNTLFSPQRFLTLALLVFSRIWCSVLSPSPLLTALLGVGAPPRGHKVWMVKILWNLYFLLRVCNKYEVWLRLKFFAHFVECSATFIIHPLEGWGMERRDGEEMREKWREKGKLFHSLSYFFVEWRPPSLGRSVMKKVIKLALPLLQLQGG